ncbi:ATP-dependent DNA helicase RecG [Planctomycetota bacterium]
MSTTQNEKTKSTFDLAMPVQFLKGVGPAKAKIFAKLGIETIADLLEYFPRDWVFAPQAIKINQIKPDRDVTIIGLVEATDLMNFRKPAIFEAMVADDTGLCRVVWFHGGYLQKQINAGDCLMLSGKATLYKHQLQLTNPKFMIIKEETEKPSEHFSGGVYPASGKLTSMQIKKIITPIIHAIPQLIEEFFDKDFLQQANLIDRADAFSSIHLPDDEEKLAKAKRRLKYDELFLMQLALALRRYAMRHFSAALPINKSERIDTRIRKRFPFLLTQDQNTVIAQITADMAKSIPMNRLLQGDVGSGKTAVALYAALLAVADKCQTAIMAPTEILAAQHLLSIERYLKGTKVKAALITSALTGKKRKQLLNQIKAGEIDIAVGTIALLNETIEFKKLGLVIIDEQHKFGVHQRAQLRKKTTPHCLVMTATPIPRTLAMTAFGDLDVSIIKHRPPGRGSVITRRVSRADQPKAEEFIRQRLIAKKQAYFVYPRITNTDENSILKAATDEYKHLSTNIYPEFKVALLHGQMPSENKQSIMADFRKGKINVLVSTVVIEVGVDVPNATMMVIEGADRFGLAQLHQLRGRIGRGQSKSYCFLFTDTENETVNERLEVMTRTNDGFEIAEHDLRLRGPGELFSTRQHGLPDLKIANIIDDYDLLTMARRNATEMVTKDPMLKNPKNKNLRKILVEKFGESIGLSNIG